MNIFTSDPILVEELLLAGESTEEGIDEREVYSTIESDLESLWDDVKLYDKKNSGHILVEADLGLWNGRFAGGRIFSDLETALSIVFDGVEYVTITEDDESGEVSIVGTHHDGTNYYELYAINEKGEDLLSDSYDLQSERLHKKLKNNGCLEAYKLSSRFGWK